MATNLEAFDKSGLEAFVKSPLNVRNAQIAGPPRLSGDVWGYGRTNSSIGKVFRFNFDDCAIQWQSASTSSEIHLPVFAVNEDLDVAVIAGRSLDPVSFRNHGEFAGLGLAGALWFISQVPELPGDRWYFAETHPQPLTVGTDFLLFYATGVNFLSNFEAPLPQPAPDIRRRVNALTGAIVWSQEIDARFSVVDTALLNPTDYYSIVTSDDNTQLRGGTPMHKIIRYSAANGDEQGALETQFNALIDPVARVRAASMTSDGTSIFIGIIYENSTASDRECVLFSMSPSFSINWQRNLGSFTPGTQIGLRYDPSRNGIITFAPSYLPATQLLDVDTGLDITPAGTFFPALFNGVQGDLFDDGRFGQWTGNTFFQWTDLDGLTKLDADPTDKTYSLGFSGDELRLRVLGVDAIAGSMQLRGSAK